MTNSLIFPNLIHYLVLAMILFVIGLIGVVTSKNLIRILISLEIIFSAINLNFIAFATYRDTTLSGCVFVLFVSVVSALQVAIALSLFVIKFKDKTGITSKDIEELKE